VSESGLTSTRWFHVSRRELWVLVILAVLVLLCLGGLRLRERIFGRESLSVEKKWDLPPETARVNINTAPGYELRLLPGIGPKAASAIIEYRQTHGQFARLEDLVEIKGIGPKTVERIRPYAMCAPVEAAE